MFADFAFLHWPWLGYVGSGVVNIWAQICKWDVGSLLGARGEENIKRVKIPESGSWIYLVCKSLRGVQRVAMSFRCLGSGTNTKKAVDAFLADTRKVVQHVTKLGGRVWIRVPYIIFSNGASNMLRPPSHVSFTDAVLQLQRGSLDRPAEIRSIKVSCYEVQFFHGWM